MHVTKETPKNMPDAYCYRRTDEKSDMCTHTHTRMYVCMYAKCIINHTVRPRESERMCAECYGRLHRQAAPPLGPLAFRGPAWGHGRRAVEEPQSTHTIWTHRIPFFLWFAGSMQTFKLLQAIAELSNISISLSHYRLFLTKRLTQEASANY